MLTWKKTAVKGAVRRYHPRCPSEATFWCPEGTDRIFSPQNNTHIADAGSSLAEREGAYLGELEAREMAVGCSSGTDSKKNQEHSHRRSSLMSTSSNGENTCAKTGEGLRRSGGMWYSSTQHLLSFHDEAKAPG